MALGWLCPDNTAIEREVLPGGIERLQWHSSDGMPQRAWSSARPDDKEMLLRMLFHDVALPGDYAVLLQESSVVRSGWWQALLPLFEARIDYIGKQIWTQYTARQMETIQAQPWFTGVPFLRRNDRPGGFWASAAFLAVRAARLKQANFPDLAMCRKGHRTEPVGIETLLGEIARQLGWSRADHSAHIEDPAAASVDPKPVSETNGRSDLTITAVVR